MTLKNLLLPVAAALLLTSCGNARQENVYPKISIFCDHIETIASQENISFAEAASRLKEIGYTGADVRVFQNPDEIRTLDSLGFAHACAIADIDYSKGEQKDLEDKAIAFMKERGYQKLLLVPGLMRSDSTPEETEAARGRITAFAERVSALGYEVMVEDYDNPRSLCYNTPRLDALLQATDKLSLVFDTGNFLYCGEDAFRNAFHYEGRVGHVHLKDRTSEYDMTCKPAGTGCVPVHAIVRKLLADGYDGWFTVEQYGSRQMLPDADTAFTYVIRALEQEEMNPQMTEYYYPSVPVMDASAYKPQTAVPEGAVVLFDGSDLSKWQAADGGNAAWTVNADGSMTVDKKAGDIRTRDEFGSYDLHVEWMVPEGIEGNGQARGNSGVYLNGLYEVQVLDSYDNPTYVDGQAASIYKQAVPIANPCNAPGQWNYYDISFTAPVLADDGTLISRPRVTVVFNGITVQDDVEIYGTTEYIGLPRKEWAAKGPVLLQSHGDPSQPISFRNIWIKHTQI